MMKFLDLKRINSKYEKEFTEAANNVISSGWYLNGENIKRFENNLANYIGCKYVVTCANGLDALKIILKSYVELGIISKGDEILVPANTYIASIISITENNLKPILIDASTSDFNLDFSDIEKYISNKTKAIMLVHLYGRICWDNKIREISKKYNLKIIEDNAQAIGAEIDGLKTGNLGDSAGFSFYPGKNLGALGDSGAIATNNKELADTCRSICNYGAEKKYINKFIGFNSRMDEIQAAFLNIKLKNLDFENQLRRNIAKLYIEKIKNKKIILPLTENISNNKEHVWHLFVVRTKEREKFKTFLQENGIETLIHYPIPPHMQQCYKYLSKFKLPVTESLHNEVLSLPIYPYLKETEVSRIINVINKY